MAIAASEFRRLLEEHQRMVYSVALRMLGDTGLAEEVAQDVFLELHDALGVMESEDHVRFWLRKVAMCRSMDALRRRARGLKLVTEEWDEERHPASDGRNAGEERMGGRVEEMVMSLPASYRAAVVLRYGEEMSPEEMAAVLGQPLATVKSDLRRGLEMLRRKANVVLKEFVRG